MSIRRAEKLIDKQERLHHLMGLKLKILTEHLKKKRERLEINKMRLNMYKEIMRRNKK